MPAPIGYEFKRKRLDRELSIAGLAKLAQVPPSTISMIESGKNRPSYATCCRLIVALEGGRLGREAERHERVVYHRGFRAGQNGHKVPKRYAYPA